MTEQTDEASERSPDSWTADHEGRHHPDDPNPLSATTTTGRWQRFIRSPIVLGLLTLLLGLATITIVQRTLLPQDQATVPLLSAPVDPEEPAGPGADDEPIGSESGTTSATDGTTSDGPVPVPGPGPPTTWQSGTTDDDTPEGGSTTTMQATPSPPSTDEPEVISARVERFRSIVAEANLTSELLTDQDVARLGRTLCTVASVIEVDHYPGFRSEVVDDFDGLDDLRLSTAELARAVDAAIEAFCPDQATRLGVA